MHAVLFFSCFFFFSKYQICIGWYSRELQLHGLKEIIWITINLLPISKCIKGSQYFFLYILLVFHHINNSDQLYWQYFLFNHYLPRLALPICPSFGGLFACDAAKKALVSCSPQLKDIWLTSLSVPYPLIFPSLYGSTSDIVARRTTGVD